MSRVSLEQVGQDLRFAFRHMAGAPLLTLTIVLVMSLGIGGNSALFTFLHHYLTVLPAGVPSADGLVRIRGTGTNTETFSYAELRWFAEHRATFTDVIAGTTTMTVVDAGRGREATSLLTRFVVGRYFPTLGVTLTHGAGLPPTPTSGESPELFAVISNRVWKSEFGSDPAIVGKTFTVHGLTFAIAGVAPREFVEADLWIPAGMIEPVMATSGIGRRLDSTRFTDVIARLAPAVTPEAATPTVAAVLKQLRRPQSAATVRRDGVLSAEVVPLRENNAVSAWSLLRKSAGLGALTMFLLLLTCTNVSSLLVGASLARRREIAVRLSLGAARRRLVQQLLTESLVLALLAGAFGLLILMAIMEGARVWLPTGVDVTPTWTSVAFTMLFATGAAVVFGLSPALHATRVSVADVLKSSGGTAPVRSRLQRTLVIAQVALTQPLMVGLVALLGAVAMEWSHEKWSDEGDRLMMLRVAVRSADAEETHQRMRAFRERLAGVPGVLGVTTRARFEDVRPVTVGQGPAAASVQAAFGNVPPGYFAAIGGRVVVGREFTWADADAEAAVSIVTSAFARRAWPGRSPLGETIVFGGGSRRLTVVGVVDETQMQIRASGDGDPQVFTPNARPAAANMVVRTSAPARTFESALRIFVQAELPHAPITQMETVAERDARYRVTMLMMTGATAAGGVVTLLLAALGLYAVIAFAVGQRTREIGIRVAIGARNQQVVRMFLGSGMRMGAIGMVVGLPLSLLIFRLMAESMLLYAPSLIVVGSTVAVLVIGVTALATWIPARRAAGVDPLVALRAD